MLCEGLDFRSNSSKFFVNARLVHVTIVFEVIDSMDFSISKENLFMDHFDYCSVFLLYIRCQRIICG